MELRTLRYFLALAQEGTISNAAKALHVTQPTLSRQLADLERGFGKRLFERGAKRVVLTEDGQRLREYAESIVELADKAEAELSQPERAVAGDVYIGCGESDVMRLVLRAMKRVRERWPGIKFHLFSGTSADLEDRFAGGLFDFMVEFELTGRPDCNALALPTQDTWGVLMRADSPLARFDAVTVEDLAGQPIIGPRQGLKSGKMREWAGEALDRWDVAATYNLVLNGALMVEEGLGAAICYDRLVRLPADGSLVFRPLDPPLASDVGVVWKKHRRLSRAAEAFLECLRDECAEARG